MAAPLTLDESLHLLQACIGKMRDMNLRCAIAIVDAVGELGLELRAGVHTGEIEMSNGDVRGLAVHIGARVASMANAGEVLVSRTVKDLVAGSGLEFEERGEHSLKGVPDRWQLFRVL